MTVSTNEVRARRVSGRYAFLTPWTYKARRFLGIVPWFSVHDAEGYTVCWCKSRNAAMRITHDANVREGHADFDAEHRIGQPRLVQ